MVRYDCSLTVKQQHHRSIRDHFVGPIVKSLQPAVLLEEEDLSGYAQLPIIPSLYLPTIPQMEKSDASCNLFPDYIHSSITSGLLGPVAHLTASLVALCWLLYKARKNLNKQQACSDGWSTDPDCPLPGLIN